jgi:hypothetical protein
VARYSLAAASLPNLAFFAGGLQTAVVDIFNASSSKWSTASLSVGGEGISATSLPNIGIALFAGGYKNLGGFMMSDAVDIFNSTTGTWGTATLSKARGYLAAASLSDSGLAFFAGGQTRGGSYQISKVVDIFNATSVEWNTASLSEPRYQLAATSLPNYGIVIFAGGYTDGGIASTAVDIFNSTSGIWSTATLATTGGYLAATSLPNLGIALFAGGERCCNGPYFKGVDIFNAISVTWSNSSLSVARAFLAAASLPKLGIAIFAGGMVDSGLQSDVVDIFNAISGTWSTAVLSAGRCYFAATSLPNFDMALFGGGGLWGGSYFNVVDIYTGSSVPETTTKPDSTGAPLPSTTALNHSPTSSPLSTSSPPPDPIATSTPPSSHIPTWIIGTAAASSGHLPRALELVQFLSLYCSSLSSRQQSLVSEFQVASFTHIASSKAKYCGVCPSSCSRPLALLLPTFALMGCLFVLGCLIVLHDAYNARNSNRFVPLAQDLLTGRAAPSAVAADRRPLRIISTFCARYLRSVIETSSAYVLMPCTFVFVLNIRPSSFGQADSYDRAMIIALPVMMLLFRALVIRKRVVPLTPADQLQLYAGSVCSCSISAVFGVYFGRAADTLPSVPSFSSDTSPQYIVLALLVGQVIAQTVIRLRATEESIFDNVDWPWSSAASHASSAVFSFDVLVPRLVVNSIRRSSLAAVIAVVKFLLLNYVVISQIAMTIAGLASAPATSAPGPDSNIETSSVIIGVIPLITSGVLLLHNAYKLARLLWRKCCRQLQPVGTHRNIKDRHLL